MLKDFWDNKKHLIQLVGILTGVGALFLSILPPENIDAKQALANIQFIWMVIITIGCSAIFISFHNFSVDLEKHFGSKWGIDLTETVSLLIFLSLLYLITNLWIYMFKLYSNSLMDYIQDISIGIISIIGAVFFHYFNKFIARIERFRNQLIFTIVFYFLFSIVAAYIIRAIQYKEMLVSLSSLKELALVFIIFIFLMTIYEKNRRKKRKLNSITN